MARAFYNVGQGILIFSTSEEGGFVMSPSKMQSRDQALLRLHKLHKGVLKRVAESLGINASYVSRVANGERRKENIMRAIIAELEKLQRDHAKLC